ncbi:class I SAM-dependent methyltransferase [Pelosinus sp. sgz500959]|uniref:class I SAM-dependent methyltransferase n=1 Tax=Pelosinus sp. sgz500959 TaxID=3242472 RepID=UPI0036703FE6
MNILNKPSPEWYKEIWSLDIQDMSWVEHTNDEVNFIIDIMDLSGTERILDLACGFGRHALELSRRGFPVVGVDITSDYINEAMRISSFDKLNAEFICADIRDMTFKNEFDVVLNMADGAVGYLENDNENLKIFDLITSSLKKGGKHFMNICNAEHAEMHFPRRYWDIGEKELSLPEFHWDKENRRMLYGGWGLKFGEVAEKPKIDELSAHSSIRLYSVNEIEDIFKSREMIVKNTFGKFDKSIPSSHREMQLLIYSQKI